MYFCLDGRFCTAAPLDEINADGTPSRLVYWYKGTEGGAPETSSTNDLVRVPEDNGASWNAQTAPHGAVFYVEVADDDNLDLNAIHQRLLDTKERRDGIIKAAQEANAGGNVTEGDEPAPQPAPVSDPADADRDGTVTKAERKRYDKEHGG